ncbi:hypothetical protein GOP47_0001973 [Adiantum capillus-veneris]|uniref:Uncharacterized protein n=1 Tax=Adiantum capillus-veneris TaxID=13818 RepID=A0A9D4V999_ADICA|nr:hypothetical protein GOP47_0001973 [Adiantum capillus-veneris]
MRNPRKLTLSDHCRIAHSSTAVIVEMMRSNMACSHSAGRIATFLFVGLLALIISHVNPVLGAIECEELPIEDCAFAVSSSGARCVLEKVVKNNAAPQYKCQTSIIMAERPMEWIESEDCIRTCGLQRLSVGLSTDALLEREFTKRLCFSQCRSKCPNINDLYTKLAAEDGIYLPSLCDSLKPRVRKLGAEQKQDQSEPLSISKASTDVSAKKTVVDIPSQISEQSLQDAVPLWTSPAPATSAGWPVTPSSPYYYPAVEEPYPAKEPYPVMEPPENEPEEAEPPYIYEYPWPTPTTPAPEPAPYPVYSSSDEPPAPAPSLASLAPYYYSV